MRKPSVNTNPVANQYSAPDERIIEFNANDGTGTGGLISFRRMDDGTLKVSLYRLDQGVHIQYPTDSGSVCIRPGRENW